MKTNKRIKLLICLFAILLCSCNKIDDIDLSSLPDTIQLQAEPGMIRTVLEETTAITEYQYVETETNLILRPSICSYDNTVYSYLPYSREDALLLIGMTQEERDAYFAELPPDYTHEIEVYNDFADNIPDSVIRLKTPEDEVIYLSQMFFDPLSENFLFKGHEQSEDEWIYHYYAFDMDGNLLQRIPLPDLDWNGELSYNNRFLFQENYIYYLQELPYDFMAQHEEFQLYRYDLNTQEQAKVETENIIEMFETNGEIYYLTQNFDTYGFSESMNLMRLQEDESILIHEGFLPANTALNDVNYDAESEILYFTDGSYVFSLSFDDGITRQLLLSGDKHLTLHDITDNSIIISNGNYATAVYKRTAEKVSLDDNLVTLNLYRQMSEDNYDLHQDIFRIMSINGFSTNGQTYGIENADEYQFAMAKKLLAGDTDFDIFYVSTEMADLMKVQYYDNLSQYPILNGYYSRMVPGAKELCSIAGIPALIPVNLYTNSMRIDKSCVTSDVNLAATLEKFWNSKDEIPLKSGNYLLSGVNPYVLMRPWFEQLISNYMANVISDKQAEKDMKLLFEMAEKFKSDSDVFLNSGASTTPTLLRVMQNIGIDGSLNPTQTAVPMLKVTEDYKQAWNGGFYAINPNSPNKERAAIFLACLMERDRNLGFGMAQIYTDAPKKENVVYGTGSDILHEVYLTQLADGIRGYEIPGFGDTLQELFRKTQSGEYTAEDAADELFRQVKMIKFE